MKVHAIVEFELLDEDDRPITNRKAVEAAAIAFEQRAMTGIFPQLPEFNFGEHGIKAEVMRGDVAAYVKRGSKR